MMTDYDFNPFTGNFDAISVEDLSGYATESYVDTASTADRARANHTGTQTAATISDFDTEVSNNANVSANTTHVTNDSKKIFSMDILDPNGAYSINEKVHFCLKLPWAITVTGVRASTHNASYQANGDIKWADNSVSYTNATVINDFDTTSGVRDDSTISSGSVAAGKVLYAELDSAPDSNIESLSIEIEWEFA